MLSVSIYKGKGLVIYKQEDVELEITTTHPEDAMVLGQILYRSKIKIVKRKPEVEKKVSKRREVDWSKYISRSTLRKIELVMKEKRRFKINDLMKETSFSRTTVLRAINVLREDGKIKIDEKTGEIIYTA